MPEIAGIGTSSSQISFVSFSVPLCLVVSVLWNDCV